MPKAFYTVREVAEMCRTSVWTIYRRMREGAVPVFRAGGGRNWLVPRDGLLHFLRQHNIPLPRETAEAVYRLLIVDDEADVCTLLARFFGRQPDFAVETANSGFRAGIALQMRPPDAILLDLQLGDMDGRDLLAHIASSPELSHVRVIGMSGRISARAAERMVDQGFDAFVPKPLVLPALLATVRQVLANPPRDRRAAESST